MSSFWAFVKAWVTFKSVMGKRKFKVHGIVLRAQHLSKEGYPCKSYGHAGIKGKLLESS